jgi:hypothetical protein
MPVVKVRKPKKNVPKKVKRVAGKVRVKKVRRDTLKNTNNIRVTVPAIVSSSGGGGASASSSSGGGGFGYPMTAGVVDNTTGNELKQLRSDVALNFQSLLGDLANMRDLDRQFMDQRYGDRLPQPTAKTVATREAGVQGDVVIPMDNAAVNAGVGRPVFAEPLNQGPVDAPVDAEAPAVAAPAVQQREPLVDVPMPREDRMEVVGRREAAREARNRAQRQAAEAQAEAVRQNGLQPAAFAAPGEALEGRNGDPMQGMDGVIGNLRLPKRTANPDLVQRMPRGAGNQLVVDPNAAARAAAERGYIERIANRQDYPLYRNMASTGSVALPLYEGRAISDRRPKSIRFNGPGEIEAGEQQPQQLQLEYMNDL